MADRPPANEIAWTDESIVCTWIEIEHKTNRRLQTLGVAKLNEEDAFLLYLCIIRLYEEGVKPTFAEIHFKLKEAHASDDLLEKFLIFYLIQSDWYNVLIEGQVLSPNLDTNCRKLISCLEKNKGDLRGRQRKQNMKRFRYSLTDTVVLLKRTPGWWKGWVDFQTPRNCFSPYIWKEFSEFFFTATSDANIASPSLGLKLFTNTRYALAKALKDIGPSFIQTMRLGDIALLIQLAIQNGFLCYESTTIVPSWTSYTLASMRKYKLRIQDPEIPQSEERHLKSDLPVDCENQSMGDVPEEIATYMPSSKIKNKEEIGSISVLSTTDGNSSSSDRPALTSASTYECESTADNEVQEVTSTEQLRQLLKSLLEREGVILLSQLRVLLQTRLNVVLTPSRFGYIKLSDLLIEHAGDICVLIRNQSRHVYIRRIHQKISSKDSFPATGKVLSSVPLKANYSVAAETFLNTIDDIWKLSPAHDVDWSVDRLKELDSLVKDRQVLFPAGRRLLFSEAE